MLSNDGGFISRLIIWLLVVVVAGTAHAARIHLPKNTSVVNGRPSLLSNGLGLTPPMGYVYCLVLLQISTAK